MSDRHTVSAVIDARERESAETFARLLEEHELVADVSTELLTAGDVVIAGVGFERKRPDDYVASLFDDRLEGQARKLDANYERSYLLFEGNLSVTDGSFWGDVSGDAIRASMASLLERDGLTINGIIPAARQDILVDIAVRVAQKHDQHAEVPFVPSPDTPPDASTTTMMYACLPGVGTVIAERLADEYPSMEDLLEAVESDEVENVDGVGPSTAEAIVDTVLHDCQ